MPARGSCPWTWPVWPALQPVHHQQCSSFQEPKFALPPLRETRTSALLLSRRVIHRSVARQHPRLRRSQELRISSLPLTRHASSPACRRRRIQRLPGERHTRGRETLPCTLIGVQQPGFGWLAELENDVQLTILHPSSPPAPTAKNPSPKPPCTSHTISPWRRTVPADARGPNTHEPTPERSVIPNRHQMVLGDVVSPAEGITACTASADSYRYCTSSSVYPDVRMPTATRAAPAGRAPEPRTPGPP